MEKTLIPVQDLFDPVKWGLIMVWSHYGLLYQKPIKHAMNLYTLPMCIRQFKCMRAALIIKYTVLCFCQEECLQFVF